MLRATVYIFLAMIFPRLQDIIDHCKLVCVRVTMHVSFGMILQEKKFSIMRAILRARVRACICIIMYVYISKMPARQKTHKCG